MIHRISRHLVWMIAFFCTAHVFAAAPVAVNDARIISVAGRITLNVMANDYDPDGDTLMVLELILPDVGEATLNNDGSILYVAPPSFVGDVVFGYVLGDNSEEGLTATGTITIRVQDSNPYLPFADNQNDRGLASMISAVCAELQGQSEAELSIAETQLLRQCAILAALVVENPDRVAGALNQIAPEEVLSQMRVATEANSQQIRAVANRIQQQKFVARTGGQTHSFALNGRQMQTGSRGAGASADTPEIWSKLGVFANLLLEESDRDQTDLENGYQSNATGFTFGADYFLDQSWLVGSSFALSDNTLDYQNDDGKLDTSTNSLSLFAAFFHQSFSFYAQAGQSWMEFDSSRKVEFSLGDFTIDRRLVSSTKGKQRSLNTRAEWDWQKDALRLTPFARIDYLRSDIDAFGEQGDAGYAMLMGDQRSSQTTLAAGLLASYVLTPRWGVLQPSIGLTYLSENQVERDPVSVRFAADPDDSRNYVLINDGGDNAFYQLSLGASAVFKQGLSGFVDFTKTLSYQHLSTDQLQLGVRYEL